MKERLNAHLHENEDAVARSWKDVYLLLLLLRIFYSENVAVLVFNGFELVLDVILHEIVTTFECKYVLLKVDFICLTYFQRCIVYLIQ